MRSTLACGLFVVAALTVCTFSNRHTHAVPIPYKYNPEATKDKECKNCEQKCTHMQYYDEDVPAIVFAVLVKLGKQGYVFLEEQGEAEVPVYNAVDGVAHDGTLTSHYNYINQANICKPQKYWVNDSVYVKKCTAGNVACYDDPEMIYANDYFRRRELLSGSDIIGTAIPIGKHRCDD